LIRIDMDGKDLRFNSSQFLTFHLEDPLLERLSAGLAVHVHLQYHGDHRWLQNKSRKIDRPAFNELRPHCTQINHCNVAVAMPMHRDQNHVEN
jgi:hypothetical protein